MGAHLLGQILVGLPNPSFAEEFAQLYGLEASVGVILPSGRAQESTSDLS
jgi:hypothetical protein